MKNFGLIDNRAEYALEYTILYYIDRILRIIDSSDFRSELLDIIKSLPITYAFNIELCYQVYKRNTPKSLIALNCIKQLKYDVLRDISYYYKVKYVTSEQITEYSSMKEYLTYIPSENLELEYVHRGVTRKMKLRNVRMEDLYALVILNRDIKIKSSYDCILQRDKIIRYCNSYLSNYYLITPQGRYYFNDFYFLETLKRLCKFVGIRNGGKGVVWYYIGCN